MCHCCYFGFEKKEAGVAITQVHTNHISIQYLTHNYNFFPQTLLPKNAQVKQEGSNPTPRIGP